MIVHSFGLFVLFAGVALAQLPPVPRLEWQLEPQPPSRNAGTFVRHEGIDATILFGGWTPENLPFGDTWLWRDGWQRIDSPVAPSPRGGASFAYDSLRQRLVLFGGLVPSVIGGTFFGDTWSFDGSTWTQIVTTGTQPPPRYSAQLAYDQGRDRVVLRGGFGSTGTFTDLWEFDGQQWLQRPQSGVNPPAGPIAYHAATQELLVMTSTGAFAWNGVQWSLRSSAPLPYLGRRTVVYEPSGQRFLFFPTPNATTSIVNPDPMPLAIHAFDGVSWSTAGQLAAAATDSMVLTYDVADAMLLGFEGLVTPFSQRNQSSGTWQLLQPLSPGGTWRCLASGLPQGRQGTGMGYDASMRRMMVIGGVTGSSQTPVAHEAVGRDWNMRSQQLTVLQWSPLAFDSHRGVLQAFSGGSGGQSLLEWSAPGFVGVSATPAPPGRTRYGIAYDSLRQRTLLFGGSSNTDTLLGDLWAWSGSAWTQIVPSGPSPSPRRRLGMCYDIARDRVVLFGGASSSGFAGETWEFDGVAWQLRSPAHSPVARAGHVLVYAPDLQRTILYGGYDLQDRRDTWLWDGTDWQALVTMTTPDIGAGVFGAYDTDRRELMVFGGGAEFANNTRGELWRLRDVSLTAWQVGGQGCDAGAGLLELVGGTPPALGTTATFRLENTPASFVALPIGFVGFDDQQWDGVPLPVSLAAFGAPDCMIWAEALLPVPLLALGTHAEGAIVLPDLPAAVGLAMHVQGVVWNFATGTIATANRLTARLGPN